MTKLMIGESRKTDLSIYRVFRRLLNSRASFVRVVAALSFLGCGQQMCNAQKSASATAIPQISIDSSKRFQTIDGFGVNFNATYFRDEQRPMIQQLVTDLGATIFRLDPYGLINWEAANDNDDPETMNWEYYNDRYSIPEFEAAWAAGRYLNSMGIQPYLTLSGVPPVWMMDKDPAPPKHDTCNKDAQDRIIHLNPAMYGEYAETVVSLAMYARNTAHVKFQYFGPVNETDCYPNEGPRIDPEEMPLVLNAVAKRLKKEGMGDVKLVGAEQAILKTDYVEHLLQQKELMPSMGAFSFHTYTDTTDVTPHIQAVQASAFPNVPVWLTEYGDLNDSDKSAENEWKGFSVAATGRALRALNQGVNAVLFWDAFDNYHEHIPGMTYYGLFAQHNHSYFPKKRYYAAKQLYHFVHPGSHRIQVSSLDGMLLSGFVNPDDRTIAVVGMREDGKQEVNLSLAGFTGTVDVYETTRQLNCQKTSTEPVLNGKATIHLERDSIFTLVLKTKETQ